MTGSRRKTVDAPPPEDTAEVPSEDLLNTSPFDGDLSEELAAAPPAKRGRPSVTVLLGAGVLLVAGFLGGIQADKQWGAKQPSGASDVINQLVRARGGQGGVGGPAGIGGGGRQAGRSASGTTGTVKLVDGDIIYVQTADGIVRVKTTGSTKVTIAKKAKPKDLKAGSSVVVQGAAGQDGTVTATSVNQDK